MNYRAILTATLALALTAPVSAAPSLGLRPDKETAKPHGGIVNGDGTIALGKRFNVSHTGTGEYVITYNLNTFKTCPVFSVTPGGIASLLPIADIWTYSCSGGGAQIMVHLYARSDGSAVDNAFQFLAIDS